MISLNFDSKNALKFISKAQIEQFQEALDHHFIAVRERTGRGNDYLGWTDLPTSVDESLISKIEAAAARFREKSEVSVVVGIGGSYLGARAVIDALSPHFNFLKKKQGNPIVCYAGNNISEDYLAELLEVLDAKDYTMTVISKSGTTTEPALAFRLLRDHMEAKYGKEESKNRIIAITDAERGALKQLADEEGYETFVVPDNVGGRYSVLTPVGLLPIAIAGLDIRKLMQGADEMAQFSEKSYNIKENPVAAYAAVRHGLYLKGFTTEIMVNYEPALFYFTEWWKQLFGESQGKEGKGIFPAGVSNTTDLHSMGQYIQEGMRNLFETVLSVEKPAHELLVPKDEKNLDKLNYLAGKAIHEVNHMAELGTTLAHVDGGVPNLRVTVPAINENTIGQLIYFYEMACAVGGYLLEINPFDQPGVEAYKKNMFALLGKPGFEKETEAMKNRLKSEAKN